MVLQRSAQMAQVDLLQLVAVIQQVLRELRDTETAV